MRLAGLALAALIGLAAGAAEAFQTEARRSFGETAAPRTLGILSTTDIGILAPVIEAWLDVNPGVRVDYTLASSQEVHRAVDDEGLAFDVVISSAMDLQMKLANDGLARPLDPDVLAGLPGWARWRDRLVAVAQEPVTVLLSPRALDAGEPVPRSRRDLLALLRDHPERFRGRVGTYDPAVSGAGYLFATQDARNSDTYWRLAEVMGRLDARRYCCSGDMIDAVKAGDLLLAYNVLGNYAAVHGGGDTGLMVIEPEDYTLVLLRTALVPARAEAPELGASFIRFLLSRPGQELASGAGGLPAIDAAAFETRPHLRPIRLDPGLLAHLDRLTRNQFLAEWRAAMEQP